MEITTQEISPRAFDDLVHEAWEMMINGENHDTVVSTIEMEYGWNRETAEAIVQAAEEDM